MDPGCEKNNALFGLRKGEQRPTCTCCHSRRKEK